jgi:L-threonylcarbamoyladenylate synthase
VSTDLIEIDLEKPSMLAIERAAAAIRRGEVVAIPTDALYTLVADPLNLHAVGRVFAAKGREIDRALPVLVSDLVMAEELARDMSSRFYLLARHFWPGPLTIIAPASSRIPLKVTGNTGRLAMRQSPSKVANALLERLSQPLISTSANLSGQPTCTCGIDVF